MTVMTVTALLTVTATGMTVMTVTVATDMTATTVTEATAMTWIYVTATTAMTIQVGDARAAVAYFGQKLAVFGDDFRILAMTQAVVLRNAPLRTL
jgi:hypothetical protein